MANPQDLKVKLTVDASGVTSGVNEATAKLKTFGDAAQNAHGPLASLGDTLKKGLGFAGLALGVGEVVGFLKESSKAAVEDQKSMALLAQQITTTTGASKEQLDAVEKQIGGLEELTGVADDKIRPAFASLVRATGDTTNAMKLQKVALDLSAGAHIPLETAAKALGKAYDGNTTALARLVPSVKGAKDPIDAVAKSMAGAAKTAADNDPYARLSVALDHIKETLGKALLPILTSFTTILNAVMPLINLLSGVIGMLVKALAPLISHLVTALMPAFTAVVRIVMAIVGAVLPPLVKILDKVLVPIIDFLANLVLKYFVPAFEAMYKRFGAIAAVIGDVVVKSFQLLIKILGPIYKTVIEPLLNGLMALMGIKPITVKVSTDTSGFKMPNLATGSLAGFTGAGAGGAGATSGAGSTAASKSSTNLANVTAYLKTVQDKVKAAQAKFDEEQTAAQEKYNSRITDLTEARDSALVNAQANFDDKISSLTEARDEGLLAAKNAYDDKVASLTAARDEALVNAAENHTQKLADIQASYADKLAGIIQQSMNRLRSAFASATATNVGTMFKDLAANGAASADGLIESLKSRLSKIKGLAQDAASLSGAGFSQAFIEQVVAQGPDAGDAMAKSLLAATPEAQSQLQSLFDQTQATSNTGMDELSKQIYDKSGLATDALKSLYSKTQEDLANALTAENKAYADQVTKIQSTFTKGMADAQKTYDDSVAKVNATFNKGVADAQKTYDDAVKKINDTFTKGVADAEDALTKSLASSAKALNDSLDAIDAAMTAKLLSLKGKLAGAGAEIAATRDLINSAQVGANGNPYSGLTADQQATAIKANSAGPAVTVTNNLTALTTADPNAIATALTNASKLNTPYIMPASATGTGSARLVAL